MGIRFNPCQPCCHDPDKCCITCCPNDLPSTVCLRITGNTTQEIKIQLVYLSTTAPTIFIPSGIDWYVGYAYWCFNFTTFTVGVSCNGSQARAVIYRTQNPYDYPSPTLTPSQIMDVDCLINGSFTIDYTGNLTGISQIFELSQDEDCDFLDDVGDDLCFTECLNGATEALVNVHSEFVSISPPSSFSEDRELILDTSSEPYVFGDCVQVGAFFIDEISQGSLLICNGQDGNFKLKYRYLDSLYTELTNNVSGSAVGGTFSISGTITGTYGPVFGITYNVTSTVSGTITCTS